MGSKINVYNTSINRSSEGSLISIYMHYSVDKVCLSNINGWHDLYNIFDTLGIPKDSTSKTYTVDSLVEKSINQLSML